MPTKPTIIHPLSEVNPTQFDRLDTAFIAYVATELPLPWWAPPTPRYIMDSAWLETAADIANGVHADLGGEA